MVISDPELAAYADVLEAAGFVIYESASGRPSAYFRYSRIVGSQECFGYVQANWVGATKFSHLMPILPSIEHGSSMWVEGVPEALTVESAALICRQVNRNPIVGQRRNFADPRFEYLYQRREPLVQEPAVPEPL